MRWEEHYKGIVIWHCEGVGNGLILILILILILTLILILDFGAYTIGGGCIVTCVLESTWHGMEKHTFVRVLIIYSELLCSQTNE